MNFKAGDIFRVLPRLPRWALILTVQLYRLTLGPVLGGRCRFLPTCSEYAIEALRRHGAVRGTLLTAWRVLRCHPFSKGGYDPVP
ncbi:MAG: membrane protein insertion efficiency factor YidD [Phycisphaerae bacterium]